MDCRVGAPVGAVVLCSATPQSQAETEMRNTCSARSRGPHRMRRLPVELPGPAWLLQLFNRPPQGFVLPKPYRNRCHLSSRQTLASCSTHEIVKSKR